MPVPDPPWKIRTRPCPFYSSGRCLFSSACNFQHVVKSSLTQLENIPGRTSATREHFGLDQDKPQNWVDSDDEEGDEDEDEDDTIDWSKRRSYVPPSIDRHSLGSSETSLCRTETGTVRGRSLTLSIVMPNVSSEESLNDDTLVNTSHSAEPEGEDELEERRMSIRFSDPRYQTTSFNLDAFRASVISVKQRRSQALSTFTKPPSPPLSISQLDAKGVQYISNRTSAWSDDSDGTSSRRTSLLSDDPGSPRSEYQELEVVNMRPSLGTEFHLALPEASSLIANRANKGGPGGNAVGTQYSDSESRTSRPAFEPERDQVFNAVQPPSLIFELDHHDPFNVIPSRRHSRSDSDCDQLPQFIPTAPLTLEPPTPNAEESPFQARRRFHKAFTLVTKELRERVKHLRELETPVLGGSLQLATGSGGGGESEVAGTWNTRGPAFPQGGAAGNNAEGEELGLLVSTLPRSESPLVYEEEPTISRGTEPEGPEIFVPPPMEDDMKSPPWLKPLRLSAVFPGGRGPLIFQPPQVPQAQAQAYPHLWSQSQSQTRSQTQTQQRPRAQPLLLQSAVESRRGSVTSSGDRSRSSRRSTRSLAAAVVDHDLVSVPRRKSSNVEVPPVPPLPENVAPSPSPFTPSAYAFLSTSSADNGPSPFTPSVYALPPVAFTLKNEALSRPPTSQIAEEPSLEQPTDASGLNLSTWELQSSRRPSIASSVFSGSIVPPSSRGSSVFQFRVHERNETNSTNLSVPHTPDVPRVTPPPSVPSSVVRIRDPISRSRSIASLRSNPGATSPLQPTASPVPSMSAPSQAPRSRPNSIMYSRPPSVLSFHSTSPSLQPSVKHPHLFFAIAASQPEEVARLLQTGEANANETVGPEDMRALEFAMESLKDGNEGDLSKREEIVTTLLSYGADPSAVKKEGNAYVKYFLDKAVKSPVTPEEVKNQDAMEEAPLARARFVIVGQEYGVRELVRSYRAHVRLAKYLAEDETELPFVALLTGPSGHGKTHLATRIGSLLGTTSYSVNMTLVRSQKEFWETVSSRSDEAAKFSSLREYLTAHDGKPGVVVVDEFEKVHDKAYLQALLVPWETGRVQGLSGHPLRSVDISKVVWVCTSNVASQGIIEHNREGPRTQEWFEELRLIARIQLGDELGASLLARVSVVIPFVTFIEEERLAISAQALSGLKRNLVKANAEQLHKVTNWEGVVARAAKEYVEPEGARSIRRGIVKWADVALRGEWHF